MHGSSAALSPVGHLYFRCACRMTTGGSHEQISRTIAPHSFKASDGHAGADTKLEASGHFKYLCPETSHVVSCIPPTPNCYKQGLRIARHLARNRRQYKPILRHRLRWAGLAETVEITSSVPCGVSSTMRSPHCKPGKRK